MADILTTSNRTNWKTQLRVKLIGENNTDILPDTTVEALIDIAERAIKKRCTDWSTLLSGGGNNKEFLIDASISMLAAMLAKPLRNIQPTIAKLGDLSEVRQINFDTLEADLYAEVDEALSNISTYTVTTVSRVGVIERSPAIYEELDD